MGAGRRAERRGRFPRPGPDRTYEAPEHGASRSFGHVLDADDRGGAGPTANGVPAGSPGNRYVPGRRSLEGVRASDALSPHVPLSTRQVAGKCEVVVAGGVSPSYGDDLSIPLDRDVKGLTEARTAEVCQHYAG